MCSYQIADKLPKGEFKRLTCRVIDFDKDATWMVLLESAGAYSPEKALSSINALPLNLLSLAAWEETYLNWYNPLFK